MREKTNKELLKQIRSLQTKITSLRKARETDALKQNALLSIKNSYNAILNLSPDPIAILQDERHKFINSAFTKTFGYTKEDIKRGLHFLELIPKHIKKKIGEMYKESIRKRRVRKHYHIELVAKSGIVLHCIVSAVFIEYEGRLARLLILHDMTKNNEVAKSLSKSKELFADTFFKCPFPRAITRISDGKIIEANEAFAKLIRRSQDEIAKTSTIDLKIWADPRQRKRVIKILRENGVVDNIEADVRDKLNRIHNCLFSALIIEYEGTSHLLLTAVDVTERRKAQVALQENERRLYSLLLNIPDVVMNVARDGTILSINRAVMPGISIEEPVGHSVYDYIALSQKDAMRNAINKVFKTGKPGTSQILGVGPKGASSAWYESRMVPIKEAGKVAEIIIISTDITERKKAQETLQKNETRYRMLAENITDLIWTMDLNLNYLYISPSVKNMRGYTAEEAFTQKLSDVMPPASYKLATSTLTKAFLLEKMGMNEPSKAWTIELEYRCKGGSTIWTETKASFLRDAKGRAVGVIGVSRDITERKSAEKVLQKAYNELKQAQEQLIQSSKMAAMGQLAAGISHELNQPLTGIRGFAQAALMDLNKKSPLRNDIKRIIEQSERMDKIIKNVRIFSRKSDFKMRKIDINKSLQNSLMLLKEQLRISDVTVKRSFAKLLPKLNADSNQLQQVFINMITNAKDAIASSRPSKGGKLFIKSCLSVDKKAIKVIFQDTGCGIPEDVLPSVFNPFFTTKSPAGGVGLGLSIVYRIIDDHRGSIDLKSKPGKGTTFEITLPLTNNL